LSTIRGKELTQEGLREVLASRMKGGRFIVDEEHFLKIGGELEAYVGLLGLIGSGRLKVRKRPRDAKEKSDVGS